MRHSLALLTAFGLSACHAPDVAAPACDMRALSVQSTDATRNEIYVARDKQFEIIFYNENAPQPADVFPEPKFTVKQLATQDRCEITDGPGIWSGHSVFLDRHARVLLLHEYSGSNGGLVFYDPKTCRRLARLDISDKHWQIESNQLRTGQHCYGEGVESCRHIEVLALDARCLPPHHSITQ